MSRPDIAVATQKVAKWATKGSIALIKRLKRILGYLRRYPDDGIVFVRPRQGTPILRQAADASLGDAPKAKSTLGNIEWFLGALIGWHSNRSKRVALSTGESEIMALIKAAKTNTYLRNILMDVPSAALKGSLKLGLQKCLKTTSRQSTWLLEGSKRTAATTTWSSTP